MFLFMITTMSLMITTSCLIALSPISLGVMIIMLAMFIASQISLISCGWFGLIIFIIYVGGMLVMFAYFAALQPNQHISSMMFISAPIMFPLYLFSSININMSSTPHASIITSITPLFYKSNVLILILLSLLLFLALIAVVKTSHSYQGPLRPFM